jgi:ribonuclease P protein component
VKRKLCLTRSTDFQRVKRTGNSFANPFMVLIAAPNNLSFSRFAIAAGRSVGNAVLRNRAKRRLRSCLETITLKVQPGWDLIIYGRKPLVMEKFSKVRQATNEIFQKANLFSSETLINNDGSYLSG